ncbi:MAG TPA: hypothetical protein VEU33_14550 [Archangium sp.]|nr:hypothetical protein [Archangium sp.]
MRRTLTCLGLLLLAACSAGPEDVIEAWKKAGQSTGEFKDVGEKLPGGKCVTGRVAGLDATLCEFKEAEQARRAEDSGWELVGNAVGSAIVSGKVLLVSADPRTEDPSGRRLNDLIQTFQRTTR